MPTNSNESPISSSTTTEVVPLMNTSISNTTTILTTTNSGSSLSSLSSSNHMQTPTPTQSNSPLQSTSKQLNKLRRFLSTLYYFGSDISNEIGERVRALMLAVINNALSVEEFHGKIQLTTSFPLRPFALPFLKSTLPLLQKDLLQLARQSKQTTSQYLAQHEEFILLPRDIIERSTSPSISNSKEQIHDSTKRKLTDDTHELDERSRTTKRSSASLNNNNNNHHHHRSLVSSTITNNIVSSTSTRRDTREKERAFTTYLREYGSDTQDNSSKNTDDDWRNAENMLNCILEMVTKAKRVLFMLQQKDTHLHRLAETNDLEWRRRHADILTQTEDRIAEVRRKAEEAVLEIKRQSIIDLQKAVSQTEQKSNEILLREREQYQRLNQELKVQTFEEAYALLNRQEDGPEQCWHCGRRAIETCSACNIARYCGQYCQHRDWDLHQKLCGPDLKRKINDNPQLHRSSFSKLDFNISLNPQTATSLNHITRINSDTTEDTPYLSVSSPTIIEATTIGNPIGNNNNNNNKSDLEKEEITTVKIEHV